MLLKWHLCFAILGLIVPSALSTHSKFYRRDYTYVEEYDAFYKLHWDTEGLTWDSAFTSCDSEGAKLFYPSGEEWKIVKALSSALPVAPNTTEIFVGLHDQYHIGEFITIDGKPTETPLNAVVEGGVLSDRCVMLDYITGQFKVSTCNQPRTPDFYTQRLPFACKKVEEVVLTCPTIDHEYLYEESAKKCYKVNNRPKTWDAAMKTCYMEGGVLAILDNEGFIPRHLNAYQEYFIGIKKMDQTSDFYTVRGDFFDDDNFKRWCNNNNIECQNYACGIFLPNGDSGRIRPHDCTSDLPFVCEMAVA